MSRLLVALFFVLAAAPANAQFASDAARREALDYYRRGQQLMRAEHYEKAAEAFQAAVARDRLMTLAHHALGEANMALRRFTSAIHAFTACREALRALHRLQETDRLTIERRRDEDIRELRDSVRRIRAGQIKLASPLAAERLEHRIEELQRQRTSIGTPFRAPAELSLALGSAYFRRGDLEEAEREWRAAVSVNPRFGEAHNNLAALYAMTGRRREAEAAVQAAERSGFRVHPNLIRDISRLGT